MNRAGWVILAGMAVGAGGAGGAAVAQPAPVVVALPEGTDAEVQAIAERLLSGAGLESPAGPPLPVVDLGPAPDVDGVAAALRDGEAAFYGIELDAARQLLGSAYDSIRRDPRLLGDGGVGVDRAASGLLTLTRLELHAGRADEALAVLTWLLGVAPMVDVAEGSQPADVVALAEQARGQAGGQIAWSADVGCRLFVHGVDRGDSSPVPVPPGPVVAWARCGGADSWPRALDVPAGGVATVRFAGIEGELRWVDGVLVPRAPLDPDEQMAVAGRAAEALGAPVVVTVDRPRAVQLVRVEPGAPPRALAEAPVGGAPEVVVETVEDEGPALAPWGWALLGVGAGLTAGGGGLHAAHDAQVADTPTADAIDEAAALRGASIGLYAAGGAALLTGVVLLVVDAASDPPTSPAPGSLAAPPGAAEGAGESLFPPPGLRPEAR